MKVTITGVTAKGMAALFVYDHIKPAWLAEFVYKKIIRHLPVSVFRAIGFKDFKRSSPLVIGKT